MTFLFSVSFALSFGTEMDWNKERETINSAAKNSNNKQERHLVEHFQVGLSFYDPLGFI